MSNILTFQLYFLFCELFFLLQIPFYNKTWLKYEKDKNSKLCEKPRIIQKMEDSRASSCDLILGLMQQTDHYWSLVLLAVPHQWPQCMQGLS